MEKHKFRLIIAIVVILLLFIFFLWYIQPKSPLSALENGYKDKEESIWRYSDFIKQIDINAKESLLFYFNGNGNVNCAVVEKKIVGYKIADVSAELPVYNDELRAGLFGSTYDKGNKWVYFGIIYDDSVERIVWNDVEAIRFSSSDLDMFYAVGNEAFGAKDNLEYHIFDSKGNELEHHKLVE
jgi:hypothetical protein